MSIFGKIRDNWTLIVIIDLFEELSRCEFQFTDTALYPMGLHSKGGVLVFLYTYM